MAAALDWEHGGRRLVELADRLGRTEGAVRQRASRLRALQLEGDASDGLGPSLGGLAGPLRQDVYSGASVLRSVSGP